MGRKRQPKQRELFFPNPPPGEAQERTGRDERPTVIFGHERPTTPERSCLTSRIARYGPVRRVVWEGGSREAPPYPDKIVPTTDRRAHVSECLKTLHDLDSG